MSGNSSEGIIATPPAFNRLSENLVHHFGDVFKEDESEGNINHDSSHSWNSTLVESSDTFLLPGLDHAVSGSLELLSFQALHVCLDDVDRVVAQN